MSEAKDQLKLFAIKKAVEEKKGEDIEVFDLNNSHPLFSYVIIATVNNRRNALAIADEISKTLSLMNDEVRNIEAGDSDTEWVLVDCDEVIVHLFTAKERERFNLPQLLSKMGVKF